MYGTGVQLNIARIQYKGFSFLITDRPKDRMMYSYTNELNMHNVTALVRFCEPSYNISFLRRWGIPVYDMVFAEGDTPPRSIVKEWFEVLNEQFSRNPDCCIAVHCIEGQERAPLMVAISLMELGLSYDDAIEMIRRKRRRAINAKQVHFLENYRPKSRLKISNRNHNSFCSIL